MKSKYLQEQAQLEETKKIQKQVDYKIKRTYADQLAEQKVAKVQIKEKEKRDDSIFKQLEHEKLEKEDMQREQNFNKLKQYQTRNEEKYKLLSKYQQANNFQEAAQKDEQLYVKNIEEKQRRADMESQKKRERKLKLESEANRALRMQIQEKTKAKSVMRQNDRLYAESVKMGIHQQENLDQNKVNEKSFKKKEYFDQLN